MCGVAGIHRRTDAPIPHLGKLVDYLLLGIEKRGSDATGILAMMDDGRVQLEKKTITASKFVGQRGRIRSDAKTVLLHTRFATTGRRGSQKDAHPHASGKVAAIHNGTIYNADEVFEAFSLPRRARVDSEVIPALIDHAGWDQLEASLSLLEGGAAVAIVNTEHPDEVVLARLRSYPLVYAVTKDIVIWASTAMALRLAFEMAYGRKLRSKIHELAEGDVVRVNGKITKGRIPMPERRIPAKRPRLVVPAKQKGKKTGVDHRGALVVPVSKRAKKRARKRARMNLPVVEQSIRETGTVSLHAYLAAEEPTYEQAELAREEEVIQLMSLGMDRADAEALYDDEADAAYLDEQDYADVWFRQADTAGMSPATRALYELED